MPQPGGASHVASARRSKVSCTGRNCASELHLRQGRATAGGATSCSQEQSPRRATSCAFKAFRKAKGDPIRIMPGPYQNHARTLSPYFDSMKSTPMMCVWVWGLEGREPYPNLTQYAVDGFGGQEVLADGVNVVAIVVDAMLQERVLRFCPTRRHGFELQHPSAFTTSIIRLDELLLFCLVIKRIYTVHALCHAKGV